jgi:hypothetical protein
MLTYRLVPGRTSGLDAFVGTILTINWGCRFADPAAPFTAVVPSGWPTVATCWQATPYLFKPLHAVCATRESPLHHRLAFLITYDYWHKSNSSRMFGASGCAHKILCLRGKTTPGGDPVQLRGRKRNKKCPPAGCGTTFELHWKAVELLARRISSGGPQSP